MIKSKSILDEIRTIPLNRIALVSENTEYSYFNIIDIYNQNKVIIDTLNDKCIAINSLKRQDLALLLCLLDGNVQRILFIPEDIHKDNLDKYYKEANINYEVSLEKNTIKLKTIDTINTEYIGENTQWIIPTSGTTNTPKLISHTFSSLTRTVKQDIEKGETFVWGLTFDIYRFSGIQVFLQAILNGSKLIIPSNDFSISQTIELFVNKACNIISATPSFWRKVLMSPSSLNLEIKNITLGGEISDQSILNALKEKFVNSKIVHIYASTEAGVGFSVKDGKEGFPEDYLKDILKDMQLEIIDNILFIRPNKQVQTYLSGDKMYDKDGFINTGDIVEVKDNRVYFKGRDSGCINVGGNKVHPEEVEFIILKSNLVDEVRVYGKKNPIMGNLVYADVVFKNKDDDVLLIKKQLIKYCNTHLNSFKVPAIIKVVESLAITKSGKIKRS